MNTDSHSEIRREELGERLMRAVDRTDEEDVKHLLALGADPDYCAKKSSAIHSFMEQFGAGAVPDGNPVLLAAILTRNEGSIGMLLEAGADVNQAMVTEHGIRYDALMLACRGGALEIVEMVLARGANTLALSQEHDYSSALSMVSNNHPEVIDLLLEYPQTKGALLKVLCHAAHYKRNTWPDRDTPMQIARRALQAGADVNGVHDGSTPLTSAIWAKMPELADFLIAQGADVTKKVGAAPMFYACRTSAAACVALLTRHGVVADGDDLSVAVIALDDQTILAVLENLHQNGIDPRGCKLNTLMTQMTQSTTVLEAVLKGDHEQSARFLFETLGENLHGKTSGGAPILRICGPKTKQLLRSLKTSESIAVAVGSDAPAAARRPASGMGML